MQVNYPILKPEDALFCGHIREYMASDKLNNLELALKILLICVNSKVFISQALNHLSV